jgi:hypothetical protein
VSTLFLPSRPQLFVQYPRQVAVGRRGCHVTPPNMGHPTFSATSGHTPYSACTCAIPPSQDRRLLQGPHPFTHLSADGTGVSLFPRSIAHVWARHSSACRRPPTTTRPKSPFRGSTTPPRLALSYPLTMPSRHLRDGPTAGTALPSRRARARASGARLESLAVAGGASALGRSSCG